MQLSMHFCPFDVCVHDCPDEQLGNPFPPLLDDPHATTSAVDSEATKEACLKVKAMPRC